MSGTRESGFHTMLRESSDCGRVLQIALVEPELQEIVTRYCDILKEEINLHRPHCLVIDLLRYDSLVGPHILTFLANGHLALRALGGSREARVLANGKTAKQLRRILSITKLDQVYGGDVYPDFESAIARGNSKEIDELPN